MVESASVDEGPSSWTAAFRPCLRPDDVVLLSGDLGAPGKDAVLKGASAQAGGERDVTSPTFNILIEYEGSSLMLTTSISTGSRTPKSSRTSTSTGCWKAGERLACRGVGTTGFPTRCRTSTWTCASR